MTNTDRRKYAKRAYFIGMGLSAISAIYTLMLCWNDNYKAIHFDPTTHPQYHAFREFMLVLGVLGVITYGFFVPERLTVRPVWWMMLIAALGYYLGWFLAGPLIGVSADGWLAHLLHLAAAGGMFSALFLIRPDYFD